MAQSIKDRLQDKEDKFSAGAAVVRVAARTLTWFVKEAQMAVDAPKLNARIAALHRSGARGFIIGRFVGNSPDSEGNVHQTYLGLTVAATGATLEDAKKNLHAAIKESMQVAEKPTMCTLDNPTGAAARKPAELRASPAGENFHYKQHVAGQIDKFRAAGQMRTVELEYVFLTYDEWTRIVDGTSSTRWKDLLNSLASGR